MERPECSMPCATCPFVAKNFGQPNPNGFDPKAAGDDFHDWYSAANILRLWEGTADGGVMLCHATDPNAANYGGKNAAPGNERPCTGSLVLVLLHMKKIDALIQAGHHPPRLLKPYRAEAGEHPMTEDGMRQWAVMIAMGRTAMLGGLVLPASFPHEAVLAVGVPWNDPLLAAAKGGRSVEQQG